MRLLRNTFAAFLTAVAWFLVSVPLYGQTFGVELHNNLMPASGGMAGTSISRPQDVQSAINGNPATIRQYRGTQFSFGGAWADANFAINQSAPLPAFGVLPYRAVSGTPGALLGNIGLTQDLDGFGFPMTMGMGLMSNAGCGVDFRQFPESNGTSSQYLALDILSGLGMGLTERLDFGVSGTVGTSFMDGPFVDVGGMTGAYGFRANVGATYDLSQTSTLGTYWQSKKKFEFEDAAEIGGSYVDLDFEHPANVGIGIAEQGLMGGRLLLAVDAIYKMHSDADTLKAIYTDQWCLQFGTQYRWSERVKLRTGYAWNENPMKAAQLESIGGVVLPDGVPGIRYVQAQFAAITQHRLTGGIGIRDFLPGIDVDSFVGYAFDADDQFAATNVEVSDNYWIGMGMTWRFGGCACPTDACTTSE